jgi:hypothetical protein
VSTEAVEASEAPLAGLHGLFILTSSFWVKERKEAFVIM